MMIRVLACAAFVIHSLWFGGLLTLFLAVGSLFQTFAPDRATAGTGAAEIFRIFERYQLVLAGLLLAVLVCWRAMQRSRLLTTSIITVIVAAGAAAVSATVMSPKITTLRDQGKSDTDEFRRLHGVAMAIYTGQTAVLLLPGIMIPLACAGIGRDRKVAEERDSRA